MIINIAKTLENAETKAAKETNHVGLKMENGIPVGETPVVEKAPQISLTVEKPVVTKPIIKKEATMTDTNVKVSELLAAVAKDNPEQAKKLAEIILTPQKDEIKKEAGVTLRGDQVLIGVVDKSAKTGIVVTTYKFKDVDYVDVRNHYFNNTGSSPSKGIAIPTEHVKAVYDLLGKILSK